MKIINPATGTIIKEIEADTQKTILNKFNDAKDFFEDYRKLDFDTRASTIVKFSESLVQKADELAIIQSKETGKPVSQAKSEILGVRDRIDYFLNHTQNLLEPTVENSVGGMVESIEWQPLGVILNISAWNYPWFVGMNVIIPALLTGNTVLYKPSEYATLTGLSIGELLHDAGVPKHAFQIVVGDGSIGSALTDLPIHGIFFTGSYATGQKIAQASAHHMIPLQMELGGKDPAYICDDVDVKQTAQSVAEGAFYNAGQSCCSVERIYVHESAYDEFVAEFVKAVNEYKIGSPLDENTFIGSLVNKQAVEKIANQVQDAITKGANLLLGGKKVKGSGNYFEPAVFTDVDHAMDLMVEESFGPIIGIQKVSSDEEAISLMNDTKYGLTASVFTKDESRARSVLSNVRSGTAYWNCADRVSPFVPWTARGNSGLGSTLSRVGIRAFLQPRSWHMKKI